MPVYEYRCPAEHITEVLRPMDRRHDFVECNNCGDIAMLIISTPEFNIVEGMKERLNRNWKKRQERKAKGESL